MGSCKRQVPKATRPWHSDSLSHRRCSVYCRRSRSSSCRLPYCCLFLIFVFKKKKESGSTFKCEKLGVAAWMGDTTQNYITQVSYIYTYWLLRYVFLVLPTNTTYLLYNIYILVRRKTYSPEYAVLHFYIHK